MTATGLREQLQATLGECFVIERELGGGGMARVFVARDETLGRDVVIKVLPTELSQELSAERFEREVRVNAGVAADSPRARTLAVLPFANLSGDTTQQYFADGLADELTTALGRTPGLRVTARSAAFAPALRSLNANERGLLR